MCAGKEEELMAGERVCSRIVCVSKYCRLPSALAFILSETEISARMKIETSEGGADEDE